MQKRCDYRWCDFTGRGAPSGASANITVATSHGPLVVVVLDLSICSFLGAFSVDRACHRLASGKCDTFGGQPIAPASKLRMLQSHSLASQSTAKDVASHGPHADAMRLPTPARAVQIPVVQSTAITALSPVHRARVILPTDRSPKASPVLRGFGFPQTVVRKAPEAKAEAKPEAKPEPLQPLQPEAAKEAAAKMSDAPKEPLSVSLDTAKEEQKETNEATKESKLEDVQAGQGEHTDSPDLLGDFRSQTSTQASEIKCDFSQSALSVPLEEEVRSVRPLPPRPQHAPDLREVCPGRKEEERKRMRSYSFSFGLKFCAWRLRKLLLATWCPRIKVDRGRNRRSGWLCLGVPAGPASSRGRMQSLSKSKWPVRCVCSRSTWVEQTLRIAVADSTSLVFQLTHSSSSLCNM